MTTCYAGTRQTSWLDILSQPTHVDLPATTGYAGNHFCERNFEKF